MTTIIAIGMGVAVVGIIGYVASVKRIFLLVIGLGIGIVVGLYLGAIFYFT